MMVNNHEVHADGFRGAVRTGVDLDSGAGLRVIGCV